MLVQIQAQLKRGDDIPGQQLLDSIDGVLGDLS
jgi:hypothetical protein